jgi:hypothetical protein
MSLNGGIKVTFGPCDFTENGALPFMRRVGRDNDEEMRMASIMISHALHLLSRNGRTISIQRKTKTANLGRREDGAPPDRVVTGEKFTIEIEL